MILNAKNNETHFLSIDLEDWHTSAYLRHHISENKPESRIEKTTTLILNLLAKHQVKATFFVLGQIVKNHPKLIQKIADEGHEIASHGYSHTPLWDLNSNKFEEEIVKTNELISTITGKKVNGFRAPYASLDKRTSWAIDILEKHEFVYDSSIFPMKTPLYGCPDAPLTPYKISAKNILQHSNEAKLLEIPFTVLRKKFISIPCTGGIYGRFLPLPVLKKTLQHIAKDRALNFYFHPWEIDKDIPRIKAPLYNQLVSYYNTKTYLCKVDILLQTFKFTSFERKLAIH